MSHIDKIEIERLTYDIQKKLILHRNCVNALLIVCVYFFK